MCYELVSMNPRLQLPFSLFSGMSLVTLANGLFGTFLGLRLETEGTSSFALGSILAAYYAGVTTGSLLSARLVARVGHIRAFAVFTAILVACVLGFIVQQQLWLWAILRGGCGLAVAGLMLIVESWINEQSLPEQRGAVFGVYMLAIQTGLGLGPLLLQAGDVRGHELFALIALIYLLASVPIVITRHPQPKIVTLKLMRFRRLRNIAPIGILGCFIAGTVTSILLTLGPIFAHNHGFSSVQVSIFMAAVTLGGVLPQYPIGWFSDRLDRRVVLAWVSVIVGIGCTCLAIFDVSVFVILLIAGGSLGGLTFTLYPLSLSHTNDKIESHEMTGANGILILMFGLGATFGPMLGTSMMVLLGNGGLFAAIACGCFFLTIYVWLQVWWRELPKARIEKTHFIPITLPQAAPSGSEFTVPDSSQLELPFDH